MVTLLKILAIYTNKILNEPPHAWPVLGAWCLVGIRMVLTNAVCVAGQRMARRSLMVCVPGRPGNPHLLLRMQLAAGLIKTIRNLQPFYTAI